MPNFVSYTDTMDMSCRPPNLFFFFSPLFVLLSAGLYEHCCLGHFYYKPLYFLSEHLNIVYFFSFTFELFLTLPNVVGHAVVT
jgi:hypothetical protein